jgi:RsiW-degrading membrane proteinase PrsW (M82 family)
MPAPVPVRRENLVFTLVVACIAAVAAVPTALAVAISGGGPIVLLAGLLALVPVGPLVAAYLWLDRYEPEPRSLLAVGLVWGGCVATFLALVGNTVGEFVLGLSTSATAAIVAPPIEEVSKGIFLLLLLLWRRHELDGVLDGIVYAGMVGIGFAFTENILYLASAYNGVDGTPGGMLGLTATFVIRCLASPFAHPFFTAFTGIGIGLGITSRGMAGRLLFPLGGLVLAILSHAAWNASAVLGGGSGFLGAYVVVMLPAFLLMVAFAIWVRGRERGLLTTALHDAANRGFIDPADIAWVVDLRSRRAARRHAKVTGGTSGARAMRAYQQAAVELGYLHHRFLSGTAPRDFAVRGQGFVERLQVLRPTLAFPPVPTPYRGGLPA